MRALLLLIAALILASHWPGQAFAQCTNPEGQAGVEVWNMDYCVMQVCDGVQWIATTPAPVNCLGGPNDQTPNVFDFTDVENANLGGHETSPGGGAR